MIVGAVDKETVREAWAASRFPLGKFDGMNVIAGVEVKSDDGRRIHIAAYRLTAEIVLLPDRSRSTPQERFDGLAELHNGFRIALANRGLVDCYAAVPQEIAGRYGQRLEKLGWERVEEEVYWRGLHYPVTEGG